MGGKGGAEFGAVKEEYSPSSLANRRLLYVKPRYAQGVRCQQLPAGLLVGAVKGERDGGG